MPEIDQREKGENPKPSVRIQTGQMRKPDIGVILFQDVQARELAGGHGMEVVNHGRRDVMDLRATEPKAVAEIHLFKI